jgi:flagellar hook assembly protein FlgD
LSFVATDLDGLADTLEVVMVVGEGGAVIELESSTLPEEFTLSQNYPNPFNPTTTIDFSIPKSSHVRLEVFNVLGQSVRVLADEYLAAGFKRVQWDGTDSYGRPVASGIYLYRLTADQFGETRKMMLLK